MKRDNDYCADIGNSIGEKLAQLGLVEVECRRFRQAERGHGAMFADTVAYYAGHGHLVALSWSVGNGHGCRLGRESDDRSQYEEWPTLWSVLGMDAHLDPADPLAGWDDYSKQFPEQDDAWPNFIVEKLTTLLTR